MTSTKEAFSHRLERSREPVEGVLAGHAVELVLPKPLGTVPHLRVTPPIVPGARARKILHVAVFTATTKMRAPSFSLPAGPPSAGGACPAAALKHPDVPDRDWICYGCYATTGNYLLPSVQAVQTIRAAWVRAALKDGTFADQLALCLENYHRRGRSVKVLAPGGGTRALPLNAGYFRIHDSGDFSALGEAYARAWFDVAARFPRIRFWAPTRDWVFDRMRPVLAAAPSNVVLRPSALQVGAPPPSVPGLAAGSAVAPNVPLDLWDCPAYRVEEHSCESAGCRRCWDAPAEGINYAPHGAIPGPKPSAPATRRNLPVFQANRRPSLETLALEFDAQADARVNPPPRGEAGTIFEAFLASGGLRPDEFREADWRKLLAQRGIADPDDQTAYLEGTAEW